MVRRFSRVLAIALCLLGAAPLWGGALALQQRMVDLYEENADAVVRVKAAFRETREDGSSHVTLRIGTGFFIARDGLVLANASRAAGADRVWIEFNGGTYATEPLGHDRLTNLSLLRVLEPPKDFRIIPVDSGTPVPAIGSFVFSIAHSLDFDSSPNFGVMTGYENRLGPQIFPTYYIRSTISVDSGEGGCPILDINGRLVGVSIASIPEIGSSYALPVEALIRVRDDILNEGEMVHSWMGFEVSERGPSEGLHRVFLSSISEDTPAGDGGLLEGDILLAIGGREIFALPDVPNAVFFTRANQRTTVRVRRDGEEIEYSIRTIPRPERDPLLIPREEPVGEVSPEDAEMLRRELGTNAPEATTPGSASP